MTAKLSEQITVRVDLSMALWLDEVARQIDTPNRGATIRALLQATMVEAKEQEQRELYRLFPL